MLKQLQNFSLLIVDSDDMFCPSVGGEGSDDEETITREESLANEV